MGKCLTVKTGNYRLYPVLPDIHNGDLMSVYTDDANAYYQNISFQYFNLPNGCTTNHGEFCTTLSSFIGPHSKDCAGGGLPEDPTEKENEKQSIRILLLSSSLFHVLPIAAVLSTCASPC